MKKIAFLISLTLLYIANINKGSYVIAQGQTQDTTSAVVSISPEEQEILENLDLLIDYEMFENMEILDNYQLLWEEEGIQDNNE